MRINLKKPTNKMKISREEIVKKNGKILKDSSSQFYPLL